MSKIQKLKRKAQNQNLKFKILNFELWFYVFSFTFLAYTSLCTISGCTKSPAEDVRQFEKGYFKDKGLTAPGFSQGVGPTVKRAAIQEIKDLGRRKTKEYDFGDASSDTLTIKAWAALNKKDKAGVVLYTNKCFEMYLAKANEQASGLTDFALGPNVDNYKQMNDVAVCYFIKGELFKKRKQDQGKAIEAYQVLIDNYPFAQYWDHNRGYYYRPAQIAKDEIRKINEGYYE